MTEDAPASREAPVAASADVDGVAGMLRDAALVVQSHTDDGGWCAGCRWAWSRMVLFPCPQLRWALAVTNEDGAADNPTATRKCRRFVKSCERGSEWGAVMDCFPGHAACCDVIVSHELMSALGRHPDADVTVAIGETLVDVCTASFDSGREKFVLHVLAEDLTYAVRKLAGDGSAIDQAAEGAAGRENNGNDVG